MTLTELTREAAGLPALERLKLMRILLELSEPETELLAEVDTSWEEEIDRRLRELQSGSAKGVPLEEVKRKIEARFSS